MAKLNVNDIEDINQLTGCSTAELVEIYNELTGEKVSRFASRDAGLKRIAKALRGAPAPSEPTTPAPSEPPPAPKKSFKGRAEFTRNLALTTGLSVDEIHKKSQEAFPGCDKKVTLRIVETARSK